VKKEIPLSGELWINGEFVSKIECDTIQVRHKINKWGWFKEIKQKTIKVALNFKVWIIEKLFGRKMSARQVKATLSNVQINWELLNKLAKQKPKEDDQQSTDWK